MRRDIRQEGVQFLRCNGIFFGQPHPVVDGPGHGFQFRPVAAVPLGQLFQLRQLSASLFQLPAGGLKLRRAGIILGLPFLQLAAGAVQLVFRVAQRRDAVIDFLQVVLQFPQTLPIVRLALVDFVFSVGQLAAAVLQLRPGIRQLLLGLRLGVVVFRPCIVNFLLALRLQAVVPGLTALVRDGLDAGCQRVHRGLVILLQTVQLQRALGGQINFRVRLVGKRLRRDVKNQPDGAVPHAGRLPLKAEIVAVAHDTHYGELRHRQLFVQIFVVGGGFDGGADGPCGVGGVGTGLHHALAGALGHPAVLQN